MNPIHIGYVPLRQALERVANDQSAATAAAPVADPLQTLLRGVERIYAAYEITRNSGAGFQSMTAQVFHDFGVQLIAQALEEIQTAQRFTYSRDIELSAPDIHEDGVELIPLGRRAK